MLADDQLYRRGGAAQLLTESKEEKTAPAKGVDGEDSGEGEEKVDGTETWDVSNGARGSK
jgi:hypothetical protein